jgi:hypothetical protein
MISVQVRNEDVRYSLQLNAKLAQLQLGSFTTINENMSVVTFDVLRSWISLTSWKRGTTT